jgi:endogenous inhibitor of DNA gyrase (YacG/DUF329 family)
MSKELWPAIRNTVEPTATTCQKCGAIYNASKTSAFYKFFFCSKNCEIDFILKALRYWGFEQIIRRERELSQ